MVSEIIKTIKKNKKIKIIKKTPQPILGPRAAWAGWSEDSHQNVMTQAHTSECSYIYM